MLAAAHSVGVELASACGGHGTCGSCRVRIVSGEISALSACERERLTAAELDAGDRLACQVSLETDARIEIPPESLTTAQRLQLEGHETELDLDPPVAVIDAQLAPPSIEDLRPDATRLLDALHPEHPAIGLPLLAELPTRLREQRWQTRVALHRPGNEIAAGMPPRRRSSPCPCRRRARASPAPPPPRRGAARSRRR